MKRNARPGENQTAWKIEADALMRGVAGAFLFGAPFIYTMEMWWKGNFTSPPHMVLALMLAYGSLLALDRAAGFRAEQSRTWVRAMADSAEGLAIALLVAALSLTLIGVIGLDDGLEAITGRIIMEALPLSIGVGVANNFLQKLDEGGGKSDETKGDAARHQWHDHSWKGTLADMGATALGATILAASIAPTDEIL
jgi:putative integral membrane protein (TIGR02587 family)